MPEWRSDILPADPMGPIHLLQRNIIVNSIVWLVGAVVIVVMVLGFLGLR
jgi:hypothetical protein